MAGKIEKIVVAGDVTIDWLMWRVQPEDPLDKERRPRLNWQLYWGTRMAARPGGALLLARMVEAATGLPVLAPKLPKRPEDISPGENLHSLVMLSRYPFSTEKKDENNLVFRVQELLGYDGPRKGDLQALSLAEAQDAADADLVIIDDAGNGFRDQEQAWPKAVTQGKPLVILKKSRPFGNDSLWKTLCQDHAERLVVVVDADDLRSAGVNISRRLSWERTAKDFLWQITTNRGLQCLATPRHLLVRFGLDGAIHYYRDQEGAKVRLYYDPLRVEGDFNEEVCPGKMTGLTIALVAAMTAHLIKNDLHLEGIAEGVREGIYASRRLLQQGFGPDEDHLEYPGANIFGPRQPNQVKEPLIADIDIPPHSHLDDADPYFWTILQDRTGTRLLQVTQNIVEKGIGPDLDYFPIARFGKLITLDRTEMESFRSIKNIATEYLKEPQTRPLSIAVFGPPGSGKSFGVTQVAQSIKVAGVKLETLEFNLSQWDSPLDLIKAFHKVRDMVLGGKVPLVFFDEFDSEFQGSLGWLKYFLDPMQSGKFKEGEIIHPIGKAIFVFAGGTSETLKKFCREQGTAVEEDGPKAQGARGSKEAPGRESDAEAKEERFRAAKGPDFVSRLKGYVNILGVNRSGPDDNLYLIRRAVLWRGLFEKIKENFPQLFTKAQELQIHPSALWAFLMAPKYKHGVRSMEAILSMSELSGRRVFEQAALPPESQLDLHVDAGFFRHLLAQQVMFKAHREKLAQLIHETYREDQKKAGRLNDDPAMQPWEALRKDLKESNRLQADQIPDKLTAVRCVFLPVVGRKARKFEFTKEEVEFLAEMEHARWMAEKLTKEWVFGPKKDDKAKPYPTHPALLPWDQLGEEDKDKDRNTVRAIPEFLAAAGFEIHRVGK